MTRKFNKKGAVQIIIAVSALILFFIGLVFHVWYNLLLWVGIILLLFVSWLLLLWIKKGWIGPTTVLIVSGIFLYSFYNTKILDWVVYQKIIEFFRQDQKVYELTIYFFMAVVSAFAILLILILIMRIIKLFIDKH